MDNRLSISLPSCSALATHCHCVTVVIIMHSVTLIVEISLGGSTETYCIYSKYIMTGTLLGLLGHSFAPFNIPIPLASVNFIHSSFVL